MGINSVVRGAVTIAACLLAGMLLPECSPSSAVGTPSGSGGKGVSGKAGNSTNPGDASSAGGTGGDGDASVLIKLDVIPSSWGELDAPHEPDVPPAPTADANCGGLTHETTRPLVDVVLVLDRSASMDYSIESDCYCTSNTTYGGNLCANTANCTTRWNAIKPAVSTTLTTSSYVNWGLKLFPSSSASNCGVSKDMEVTIKSDPAQSLQSQTDIQTQVNTIQLSLGTPTAAALLAATAYLKTLPDSNKKFILLATDGQPNCGGNPASINSVDVPGATSAATAANTAGFPVYVVGIGPSLDNLTQIAKAGGTTDYYPVSSPDQLAAALSTISKLVGSCSFTLNDTPPDPNNIAVYVNKGKVDQGAIDGWTYDATSQAILLTGTYCDDIKAGKDTAVQILFGCPGSLPFPPFVP